MLLGAFIVFFVMFKWSKAWNMLRFIWGAKAGSSCGLRLLYFVVLKWSKAWNMLLFIWGAEAGRLENAPCSRKTRRMRFLLVVVIVFCGVQMVQGVEYATFYMGR